MNNQEKLLSILIPTKNRYRTLFVVIESILKNVNSSEIEVIIQDNSDDNKEALDFIKSINDSRLVYDYIKDHIPISDNTCKAIENSSGKYLCFIGDDDFVNPNILEFVKILDKKEGKALIYDPGYYWWDSVLFAKTDYYHDNKKMWIPEKTASEFKLMNSELELETAKKKGMLSYYNLPRFYHGIVRKDVLVEFKKMSGSFLIGSCPDISFAVTLSCLVKEYYHVRMPLTIFGACKNSGGGLTASRQHYKKLEEAEFLRKETIFSWNEKIPKIWSQKSIYPQTAYEVLKFFKKDFDINFPAFYGAMLVYEPYLYKFLFKVVFKNFKLNLCSYFLFLKECLKKLIGLKYHNWKLRNKKLNFVVENNIESFNVVSILKDIK